ncbi:MAG: hypothetical protein EPN39_13615 [Chitinophagaceae bacterium]|nr:MAG: hypothetical protein EPN39_13615 [Chitinophagaceae bacterium]
MKRIKGIIPTFFILGLSILIANTKAHSQGSGSDYPIPAFEGSSVPPSPDAESIDKFGQIPVALYTGIPQVSIPVYTIKCGSLSLPISLIYNYNGLKPREDAGWVGMGWSLFAGGVVTRIMQGQVDGTRDSGFNYDQYNIADYLPQDDLVENLSFFEPADSGVYDLAPDIFSYQANAHNGKFIWYKGKAYLYPLNKDSIFKAPGDDYVDIISGDGTTYEFDAKETTTQYVFEKDQPHIINYVSSWFLTQIISADKKDTIQLHYSPAGTYYWSEYADTYTENYSQLVTGGGCSQTGLTDNYSPSPSIQTAILQSIDSRNIHISFTVGSRTDINGNYPELSRMDVTDKITGKIIHSYVFDYDYFGMENQADTIYRRLKLKQFRIIDPNGINPDKIYAFNYVHEYGSFPSKGTKGIDHWGYYNGADTNIDLFPSDTLNFGHGNRTPDLQYCSYGALDTIIYPTAGKTILTYAQNTYYNGQSDPGPGIRISAITNYAFDYSHPSLERQFFYQDDSGRSSGFLRYPPIYYSFPYVNNSCEYNIYQADNNGSYGSIISNPFYYREVTERDSSNKEVHKTDYYFNTPSYLYGGVSLTKQIDYYYDSVTAAFTPQKVTSDTFQYDIDTMFIGLRIFLISEMSGQDPVFGLRIDSFPSFWKYQESSKVTFYDHAGNSISSEKIFHYNPGTKNLSELEEQLADGSETIEKFKYPEDYINTITGDMVYNHVLNKIIEHQTWLKKSGPDSSLISGTLISYDPSVFFPQETYQLYIDSPLSKPDNETKTGNLYNTLISDSHYHASMHDVYNQEGLMVQQYKDNGAPVSYIWGYNDAYPIAIVHNAASNQVAYSSFETSDKGNWSYNGVPSAGGKTGIYEYALSAGMISSDTLPAGTYYVTYWSTGTNVSITGGDVSEIINGETDGTSWKFFKYKVTLNNSHSIQLSGSSIIDELRLYPTDAAMTTYTYYPGIGISSKCDADNTITYFGYNGFNELNIIKDQQGNIIKTIKYHNQQ